MTKVFFTVGDTPDFLTLGKTSQELDEEGYVNRRGLSRKHIFESVKHSLERLQLDYVDLLQCHRFDDETPIEETVSSKSHVEFSVDDRPSVIRCKPFTTSSTLGTHDILGCRRAMLGNSTQCKVRTPSRAVATTNLEQLLDYAIQNGLTPFISMQNHYNLVYREEEREMFPTLKYFGVGSIPWSPLARGKLTRPLSQQTTRGGVDRIINGYTSDSTDAIVKRVEELASKKGVSMAQVSLAWVLNRDGVSAPIVGTTSLENLYELLVSKAAIDIKLSEEEIQYLQEPYKARAVMGHI
ncbi:hypothetical protein VNI00_013664 [Paramarasmius palmivorus]|uniref:NADP-dependent oxidoreductase domain-containing protein n=1 Tax=Paramarasmius palmivorus TaxID=297713 RepID=A0AAW0BY16_9AGAR